MNFTARKYRGEANSYESVSLLGTSPGPNGFDDTGINSSVLLHILSWYRTKYFQYDSDFEQKIQLFRGLSVDQLGIDKAFQLELPQNSEPNLIYLPFSRARDFLDQISPYRCPSQLLHHVTAFFELIDIEVS